MAIAGVGSVAASLGEGLAREGRTLLGGDAAFSLIQREAKPDEVAFLRSRGEVSVAATLRAMARAADGRLALVELKAVDGHYPMLGELTLDPAEAGGRSVGRAGRRIRRRGGSDAAGAARSQARRSRQYRQCPVFKSAASSTASRTSLPAGSASARDSWSAKLLCAPPGCCNPVAWCAGSTGSSCRTTPPTIAPPRRWSMMRAPRCRKPAGRFAPAAMPRRSLSAASAALPSSSRWSGSRRCWSAVSASPTRSRAISIAAATSSPRSRRSAPPAATSSPST